MFDRHKGKPVKKKSLPKSIMPIYGLLSLEEYDTK